MSEFEIETKRIEKITFALLSEEQIRKGIPVTKSQLRDENNKILDGGLFDLRMGPVNKEDICKTCQSTKSECPGHFGYIELAKPIFNPIYMTYILKIYKCLCPICHHLICHDDDEFFAKLKSKGEQRFKDIFDHIQKNYECCGKKKKTKNSRDNDDAQRNDDDNMVTPCSGQKCDYSLGTTPSTRFQIFTKITKSRNSQLQQATIHTAETVLDAFRQMDEADVRHLGLDPDTSHPKFMVLTVLPVCPPSVRPTAARDKGKTGEDDLTILYQNIISSNEIVKAESGKQSGIVELSSRWNELQIMCAKLFMKGVKDENGSTKKKMKSIEERLSGKQGRLRLNLMGKRVDFSARTVISPDPNLSMDEVGVPIGIAKVLTFPERVTKYNIEEMQKLVHNGADNYPGACKLEKKSGAVYILNDEFKRTVDIGDVVHRYLKDGDYVIFNRQPSLHRMSMMGHKVRVLPFSTFRMNLCDTTPYNADFDGDEMNLHVPQTLEARAEIATIMLTPTQILTPEKNAPIMGIVQDSQCASYIITKRETFIEQTVFFNILQWLDNFNGIVPVPAILKPTPKWTGKQVFTTILPDLNYNAVNWSIKELLEKGPVPNDDQIYIHNGIHMTGFLSNGSGFGRKPSHVIQSMWKDCGMTKTKEFFNKTQQTVNSWFLTRGFTVGMGDIVVKKQVHDDIQTEIDNCFRESQDFLKHEDYSVYKKTIGNEMFEKLENGLDKLNMNLKSKSEKIVKAVLRKNNNLLQMVDSGSKGSMMNIMQMIAFVGKQEINGERIPFGFYKRTLPHYWKEDYGFVSRGFVENGYVMGLTPQEMFFHAMAGRQGIIDTAIKTAETGYIQRRLVKNMEDVQSKYDRTVRRTTGDMVEFIYGCDGSDGLMCESQRFNFCFDKRKGHDDDELADEDRAQFHDRFVWNLEDEHLEQLIDEEIVNKMRSEEYRELFEKEKNMILEEREEIYQPYKRSLDLKVEEIHVPVHLRRQINNVIAKHYIPRSKPTDLDPKYVIERNDSFFKELEEIEVRKDDAFDRERSIHSLETFKALYHSYLSSKQCVYHYHFTKDAYEDLLQRIKQIHLKGMINPGEMIGSIAAQSIGAPATQMTLNTFHHAGISSANVTQGVPRLKELLNMSTVPKTPSMKLYLTNDTTETRDDLNTELKRKIPYTKLKELVKRAEIWFYPDVENPLFGKNDQFLQEYVDLNVDDINVYSRWTIRLVLEYNRILASGIDTTTTFLSDRIKEEYPEFLVAHSPRPIQTSQNEMATIVYIRLPRHKCNEKDNEDEIKSQIESTLTPFEINKKALGEILDNIVLFGIENVSKIIVPEKPETKIVVNPETKWLEEKKQWYIETEGSNLKGMLALPNVDFTKTTTNNVFEIYEMFGIEAGRLQLACEFLKTLGGSYVNYRHLGLLADVMTSTGKLQPVNRFGLSRGAAGVITRASFEQTLAQFKQAAAFGESDTLNGVSQNILLGQRTIVGTGSFTVLIDLDTLKSMNNVDYMDSPIHHESSTSRGLGILDGFVSPVREVITSPSRQGGRFSSPMKVSPKPSPMKPSPYYQNPMQSSPINQNSYFNTKPSPYIPGRSSPYIPGGASPYNPMSSPYNPVSSPFIQGGPGQYQPRPSPRPFASPYISSGDGFSNSHDPNMSSPRQYQFTTPSLGRTSSPMNSSPAMFQSSPAFMKKEDKKDNDQH